MKTSGAQPDQQSERWDDHVLLYESVFEDFSLQFAEIAIRALDLRAGQSVLDVGAGSGGVALTLARRGYRVSAIDASSGMVARINERVEASGLSIDARIMDGEALSFADAQFDAALSVFGVILFPNAERGLQEIRRVVRSGGHVAVVTWTEPENYQLASELRAAVLMVKPDQPMAASPAQLRYREHDDFAALFRSAGFDDPKIDVHEATLHAPSAKWLAERLAFAPGMAAQLDSLGADADDILKCFIANLETRHGDGAVALTGRAFVGTAIVP